jgi:xanthine dehydrogenase accessory factor
MYDVALSVLSCLRANTEVHVAWLVSPSLGDPSAAVAVTPGGGRMGELLGGALDHVIRDAVRTLDSPGTIVDVDLGPAESLVIGQPTGTRLRLAVVAGKTIPREVWEDLAARRPTGFALQVRGSALGHAEQLESGDPGIELTEDRLITSLVPVTRVVIAGGGPIAEALTEAFGFVGWQASVAGDVGMATGMMTTLSPIDSVVVLGHDVEPAGRALQAAIGSQAGYIASIGSGRMQELRREWLAFRGVDWDDRVHGPAGLDIGAANPPEIAISIVAEAIAALRRS